MSLLKKFRSGAFLIVLLPITTVVAQTLTLDSLQRRFVDQRFGMFIHFNMNTYSPGWANNRVNPLLFNPTKLNCGQWAAAAKSAGMKFGILTCRHHDGFTIWPTKQVPPNGQSMYTIAQSSQPNMDVVKAYTDSFRAYGLGPGLYMSMWDIANGVPRTCCSGYTVSANDTIYTGQTCDTLFPWTPKIRNYVLGQLTELLGGAYGQIPMMVFDGYSWAMGHKGVPWQVIRDTIKAMQPNCLIIETNGMREPWESDIFYVEEPLGNWCPPGNTFAACQANCIGSNWFWDQSDVAGSTLKSVAYVVTQHLKALEPLYCTFILDCPPNQTGMMDTAVVNRLAAIGAAWSPNTGRAPLPKQQPMIEEPITPVSAVASSGKADSAIDDHQDWTGGPLFQQCWRSTGTLPQYLTLDLGKVYTNVSMLFYLPRRDSTSSGPTLTGNVLKYRIYVSTDSISYNPVTIGTDLQGGTFGVWPATRNIKKVSFPVQSAKFVRLEIDSVYGGTTAVINEIAVGGAATTTAILNRPSEPAAGSPDGYTLKTASGRITFDASLAGKTKMVSLYSLSGKLLSMRTIRKNSINIEQDMGVPSGVYVLKVKELAK